MEQAETLGSGKNGVVSACATSDGYSIGHGYGFSQLIDPVCHKHDITVQSGVDGILDVRGRVGPATEWPRVPACGRNVEGIGEGCAGKDEEQDYGEHTSTTGASNLIATVPR
ncbi:MAG: hypothetical protein JXR37_01110 [Kiritimatiellae bacterium]|nr:hypothetical protein [Kiritimatiellia bacterium]